MVFAVNVIAVFVAYLVFVAPAWDVGEVVAGGALALVVGAVSLGFRRREEAWVPTPARLMRLAAYPVPFLAEVAHANLEVAMRVITGRIRPGIIRYDSGLKTDAGVMMLGNSITLTPGTLTVDVDEETNQLYVHVLNIAPGGEDQAAWRGKDIFRYTDLSALVRRITE